MNIRELVLANRSYRRFKEDEPVETSTLKDLIDLARCSASAANLQSLKYIIANTPERCELIYPTLSWAGYMPEWPGPEEGERPPAYIIIIGDTEISKNFFCDHGIAAQSILLGAAEKGVGGCMIGSIDRDALRRHLLIPEKFEILLVIAMGYPAEKVVLEEIETDGSIKYYRDDTDVHHVPKRKLNDLIVDL